METIRKTGASIARIAVYLLAALVFLLPLIRLLLMGVTVENGYGLDNLPDFYIRSVPENLLLIQLLLL